MPIRATSDSPERARSRSKSEYMYTGEKEYVGLSACESATIRKALNAGKLAGETSLVRERSRAGDLAYGNQCARSNYPAQVNGPAR